MNHSKKTELPPKSEPKKDPKPKKDPQSKKNLQPKNDDFEQQKELFGIR